MVRVTMTMVGTCDTMILYGARRTSEEVRVQWVQTPAMGDNWLCSVRIHNDFLLEGGAVKGIMGGVPGFGTMREGGAWSDTSGGDSGGPFLKLPIHPQSGCFHLPLPGQAHTCNPRWMIFSRSRFPFRKHHDGQHRHTVEIYVASIRGGATIDADVPEAAGICKEPVQRPLESDKGLDLASTDDRELAPKIGGPGYPFLKGSGVVCLELAEAGRILLLVLFSDPLWKLERVRDETFALQLGLGRIVVWQSNTAIAAAICRAAVIRTSAPTLRCNPYKLSCDVHLLSSISEKPRIQKGGSVETPWLYHSKMVECAS
ncbi:hypothetical protein B0H14DRAFT_2617919 [Mycena olivaceomarginata]|nr:hypothetical protein B0H14DRAFT_2617919 [Mycena olivaceomarginata]